MFKTPYNYKYTKIVNRIVYKLIKIMDFFESKQKIKNIHLKDLLTVSQSAYTTQSLEK